MKKINTFANGEIEVEFEEILESLYDIGEYIEFENHDYLIIDKKEKRYILRG